MYPPGQQCLIINSIVRTVQALREWTDPAIAEAVGSMEAMICIGDGYIYVFENPSFACVFASCLAYLIEVLVARKSVPVGYHFRMSVHADPVYSFWDPGRGGWNYIGDGINGGQRVLGAIGKDVDDVLFISSQIKQSLTASYDGTEIYTCCSTASRTRAAAPTSTATPGGSTRSTTPARCRPSSPGSSRTCGSPGSDGGSPRAHGPGTPFIV